MIDYNYGPAGVFPASDMVTIPRAKYEALMVAAMALADVVDWGTIGRVPRTHTNEDVIQALEVAAKAIVAMRAAGIDLEAKG